MFLDQTTTNPSKSVKSLKQLNKSTGRRASELRTRENPNSQHGDLFDRDQTIAHTTPEIRAEQLPSAAPTCSGGRGNRDYDIAPSAPAPTPAPAPAPPRPSSVATLCATLYTAT